MGEKVATRAAQERLTNYDPTDGELLEMFIVAAGGSLPFPYILSEGLRAASEKFPPLGVFVDDNGINHLSTRFNEAFEGVPLSLFNNEQWGIPRSGSRRSQIKSEMGMMLTPQGKTAFEEAAKAANDVWSKRAI